MRRHQRLSKSEMIGFIILVVIIFATVTLYSYRYGNKTSSQSLSHLTDQERRELKEFSSALQKETLKSNQVKSHSSNTRNPLTPFVFDPNTADSLTLSKIGLKEWQIRNILKYRNKGGKWRRADDFAHVYGLSTKEFSQLRPFIRIAKTPKDHLRDRERIQRDSIHHSYPQKFKEGTLLTLDTADTTALKGIPGIGSYYANKICRYRDRLGGFVNTEQLKEIEGLPSDIEKWFVLSPKNKIRQTKLNRSSFKELIKHPYLNYEQVKAIKNYIQKYGNIQSWEDLSNSEYFSEKDFERLTPYFSFE